MKPVLIVLLAVVAMAAAQGVNVVDNNNPGHVNVVDNSDPRHVNVVDHNPLGDLVLDKNLNHVNVVNHNQNDGVPGIVVDPAFYVPSNPNGGYEPISTGPALVEHGQQNNYYPQKPYAPGTHPGARGGRK